MYTTLNSIEEGWEKNVTILCELGYIQNDVEVIHQKPCQGNGTVGVCCPLPEKGLMHVAIQIGLYSFSTLPAQEDLPFPS